jgi:hypothetical protein
MVKKAFHYKLLDTLKTLLNSSAETYLGGFAAIVLSLIFANGFVPDARYPRGSIAHALRRQAKCLGHTADLVDSMRALLCLIMEPLSSDMINGHLKCLFFLGIF